MARPKKEAPNRSDGTYEVKVTVGKTLQGKLIRKSFYSSISKADALKKAEEYKINQEATARTGIIVSPKEMTFAKWAEKWLTVYKKPNVTENSYEATYCNSVNKHIVPYFGTAKLTDIKPADVQAFYAIKQKELSTSMMKKINLCLNGIFETAIDNDFMYKNPAKNVDFVSAIQKKEKHVYTDEQIEIAKAYFKNTTPEIYVLLDLGIRRGELIGLMWSDINFDKKTISINRSIARAKKGNVTINPPKWNSYRILPISQDLLNLLNGLPRKGLYVFCTDDGNIRSVDGFVSVYVTAMQHFNKSNPNIPILTPHELRHTRGTQLRRDGVDIYTIQKLMGHKDVNVTANIYVHDDVETTRKMAKII